MKLSYLFAVLVGGGAGSVLRYILSFYAQKIWGIAFPIGTLLVNLLGCFFIGFAFSFLVERLEMPPFYRLLLITGFLGGFTTFSTFSYETVYMLMNAEHGKLALYTLSSVLLGYLMTFLGYSIGKLL